jgi:hypothetical protein
LRFSPLGAALSALRNSMHGFEALRKWGVGLDIGCVRQHDILFHFGCRGLYVRQEAPRVFEGEIIGLSAEETRKNDPQ